METYHLLQGFALSWALVFLTAVFVAVVFWVFRPGGRRAQDQAARSIFRHEDRPAGAAGAKGPNRKEPRS